MTTSEQQDIDRDLRRILVKAAGVDPALLTDPGDQSLAGLGMDSLAAMELQAVVKTEHGVQLPDELLERTVPEVAELIRTGRTGKGR
ncbi:acyl carrier protein [Actinoplanes sp. NPDC051411]|uniref:acyl carrier protein n=1 Tax=Actinoplanes sp. NPDC051411 TaxID=3155522 RepID=UPI003437B960